jgi:hypothetical protein
MVCRVISKTDKETGEKKRYLRYLDGLNRCEATSTIAFKGGLKKGEYIVFYQSQFTREQLLKIVVSVYGDLEVNLRRVSTEKFGVERFFELT